MEDLVWLPRLLQKARRLSECRKRGVDAMEGYLSGDNNFIDKRVLRFLRTNDVAVRAAIAAHESDADAAKLLVEQSGRTVAERRAYGASLRRNFFDFAVIEADEGRLPPGLRRTALSLFYNYVMMPPVYALFHRAERKRGAPEWPLSTGGLSSAK